MDKLLDFLALLLGGLFGTGLRPAATNPTPRPDLPPGHAKGRGSIVPEQVDDDADSLDPEPPVPPAPAPAPQIHVPRPDPYPGPGGAVARALARLGHGLETNGRLNVVAIRNSRRDFDLFRCRLVHLVRAEDGRWLLEGDWPITTYPGKYYMVDKLLNPRGAAILRRGQYRGVYRLDSHRGIYQALCQRLGPVSVYRDGNRDRVYDLDPKTAMSGYFGINVHATQNPDGKPASLVASRVHSASAGCLVFARIGDFVDARLGWRADRAAGIASPPLTLIEDRDLDDPGAVSTSPAAPQIDDDPGAWFPVGFATVGVRNRNLLNVKGTDQWLYSLGTDARGHHIFPSFPKGLRAGIITLRSYWTRHSLRTISGILARWAPSTDTIGSIPGAPANSPAAYSRFVAGRMGISPTDRLMTFTDGGQVRSPDQLFALVAAMVAYENGSGLVLPRAVFDDALALV